MPWVIRSRIRLTNKKAGKFLKITRSREPKNLPGRVIEKIKEKEGGFKSFATEQYSIGDNRPLINESIHLLALLNNLMHDLSI